MPRRKRASASADVYRRTFESLPIGLSVWHLENPDDPGSLRLLASNTAAADATGLPRDQVLGKTMTEAHPQAVAAGIAGIFAEVVRTGQMKDLGEVAYGDARVREGIYTVFAFPLPGDCVGLAFENITQRKLAEAAREREVAIERLRFELIAGANQAATAPEALQRALDLICNFTKWPVGHVYVRSPAGDTLVSAGLWHIEDAERFRGLRTVSEATSFRSGIGLPGRVWQRREPAWIIDVGADPNFPRAKMLDDIGVKAAFGFPVIAHGEVTAVLEFFSAVARLPDQELLEIMPDVGKHLGKVVERSQHGALTK